MYRILVKISALVACLAIFAVEASASYATGYSNVVSVRNDRGGRIINYALRVKKLRKSGSRLRLSGRCDSACTIYMSMPSNKLCIGRGTSFGFHLPYGVSKRNNQIAAQYMMKKYPGWVRRWIKSQGGLSNTIKRMNYTYARNHIRSCAV